MAVQGVGFNTKGLHHIRLPGSRRNTKVGSVWFNLLQRCYSESIRKKGKRVHLGTYETQEEAHKVYIEEKQRHVREVAESYKSKLDQEVYLKLSQYTTH